MLEKRNYQRTIGRTKEQRVSEEMCAELDNYWISEGYDMRTKSQLIQEIKDISAYYRQQDAVREEYITNLEKRIDMYIEQIADISGVD